ncbi:MAG: thiaminase II [Corynebacterium casei]|uniref:Aminopyrimidine aminohydrolase n=2 Tax=Corynebacterium casei TaxID=160386 RepID=G7I221_9CORY|nr:thiaminase II [Corynebacterium casei]AHI18707.1 TENA/THI-4 protein [Corynebacterium casei LMG S-19264]MDN5800787.1 thiaminase II [Corynebacterium casei]MDN5827573.1 thiaminase II [Corynebacterium casei]MDN5923089.1 thiaminase II [Corynebacterium casei]MDN6245605.1 thiaminase II [Corynebacterium casei]
MTLFADLKKAIGTEWTDYTEHEFVQKLGAGTLPLPVFQDYLVQDYHFLVQFARANALAAYKSRNLADIKDATGALQAIVHETDLHRRLTARWGITEEELDAAAEKQTTVAYTRYVLDTGMSGDLLDMHVALSPCSIGYAEIGAALEPQRTRALDAGEEHPYGEWIAEYSGTEFQTAARAATERLDALTAGSVTAERFDSLVEIFRAATRLEAAFWQQALDSAA